MGIFRPDLAPEMIFPGLGTGFGAFWAYNPRFAALSRLLAWGLAGSAAELAATAPAAILAFFAVNLTVIAIGTVTVTRSTAAGHRYLRLFRHRTSLPRALNDFGGFMSRRSRIDLDTPPL